MKQILIVALFSVLLFTNAVGQGCSDAGFCTMGAMKPDQPFNKKLNLQLRSMEISFYRGTTTMTPVVYVANADLNFSLNDKTSFQVKLPYQSVQGKLANTSGVGDISLCITRNIASGNSFDLNVSLGGKIPTNHSNKEVDGRPLPMYYQTSLGTYDLISGMSLISRKWLLATGIQIPLNENKNQFVWGAWSGTDEESYVLGYHRARNLRRGIDVMLRVERNFRFSRFNFSLGLLPIYRVTKDEIDLPPAASPQRVEGKGLAMSGIFTTGYSFNTRNAVRLLLGHKIVQRDFNPDGLTRNFVSTVSYVYRF